MPIYTLYALAFQLNKRSINHYLVAQKIWHTFCSLITSSNIDQFSKKILLSESGKKFQNWSIFDEVMSYKNVPNVLDHPVSPLRVFVLSSIGMSASHVHGDSSVNMWCSLRVWLRHVPTTTSTRQQRK